MEIEIKESFCPNGSRRLSQRDVPAMEIRVRARTDAGANLAYHTILRLIGNERFMSSSGCAQIIQYDGSIGYEHYIIAEEAR